MVRKDGTDPKDVQILLEIGSLLDKIEAGERDAKVNPKKMISYEELLRRRAARSCFS